jgi:hypothetical protein
MLCDEGLRRRLQRLIDQGQVVANLTFGHTQRNLEISNSDLFELAIRRYQALRLDHEPRCQ